MTKRPSQNRPQIHPRSRYQIRPQAEADLDGHALTIARDNLEAALRLYDASFDDMKKRLEGLAAAGNPWRHSARELLGLSAFRTGNLNVAERYFNVMLGDRQTPDNMRRRAEMMLSLLVQSTGAPAPAGN